MNNEKFFYKNLLLIGLIILLYNNESSADKLTILSIQDLLKNSYKKDVAYQAPTSLQMNQAQVLFTKAISQGNFTQKDIINWQNLGFKIEKVKENNIDYIVIREHPEVAPAGRGFYLIKINSNSFDYLQAPHRPTDQYTHKIIFKLLLEGNYKAAGWNSIIRKISDLAKEPDSYFNAFTIAIASSSSQPRIFQLHAFDMVTHKIEGDMILSSTKKNPEPVYANTINCLKQNKSFNKFKILQFPYDIDELGGTRNVNAKLFYQQNPRGLFFHMETSIDLRLKLRDDKILRDQFSKCLIEDAYRNLNNA